MRFPPPRAAILLPLPWQRSVRVCAGRQPSATRAPHRHALVAGRGIRRMRRTHSIRRAGGVQRPDGNRGIVMLQKMARAAFTASLLCTAAAITVAVPFSVVHAEDKVGKEVGVPLSAAQKAMQTNDWAGAMAAIKQAQAIP